MNMNHACPEGLADTIDLAFYPNRVNYDIFFDAQLLNPLAERIRHPCTFGSLVECFACVLKSLSLGRSRTQSLDEFPSLEHPNPKSIHEIIAQGRLARREVCNRRRLDDLG
jgi:hypothetical protein